MFIQIPIDLLFFFFYFFSNKFSLVVAPYLLPMHFFSFGVYDYFLYICFIFPPPMNASEEGLDERSSF